MSDSLRTFDGAVAIVTGGASGIGKALAEALASRGAHVVAADIDAEDAEAVAEQIRNNGGSAAAANVDVCDWDQVSALIRDIVETHGRLDYLFNNAGISAAGEAANYTRESWDRVIAVNLNGVAYGVQAAYPVMIRQGYGHIVNIASLAGIVASPALVSYSATKHAVVGLSKALRVEARHHGVQVSVVCPGVIRTPILRGGRHSVFSTAGAEEQQRVTYQRYFEGQFPMEVTQFAQRTLDQVAKKRAVIVVPARMRIAWWIERVSVPLGLLLARTLFSRYQKILADSA